MRTVCGGHSDDIRQTEARFGVSLFEAAGDAGRLCAHDSARRTAVIRCGEEVGVQAMGILVLLSIAGGMAIAAQA